MTDKQKYLRACEYAINEMIGRGSYSLAINIHSNQPTMVKWKDALEWVEKEYEEPHGDKKE